MQLRTSQDRCHCNLINKLNCIDLLLVLLQISTRVCVLLDYIVFRSACDYYLEKRSWRRPRRGAGVAAVHHVLPPPVRGAHLYIYAARSFVTTVNRWLEALVPASRGRRLTSGCTRQASRGAKGNFHEKAARQSWIWVLKRA